MLRAPAEPITANAAQGSAARAAAVGAATPAKAVNKPTGKGPRLATSFDTPQAAAVIVFAAIAMLVLIRKGFGGAGLGD